MCNIWAFYRGREGKEKLAAELSLDQVRELFDRPVFSELDEVIVTGGEPFLRPDLEEMFVYFRTRFPRAAVTLITNGIKIVDILAGHEAELPWTTLLFSVDGIGETHDAIRGVRGNFNEVLGGLRYYRERYPDLKLGVSFTVLPGNCREVRKVYDLSRELGVAFTMRFAGSSATYYGNQGRDERFTEEMLEGVDRQVEGIVGDLARSRSFLHRHLNPDLYFFSQMVSYQRCPRRLFRCFSGTHSFFLDPYGNVFPCIYLEKPMGNAAHESFDEFWWGEEAERQRRSIANEECHCWSECEAIPSLQRNFELVKRKVSEYVASRRSSPLKGAGKIANSEQA
jgi:radical SAM protein with 4Fe4S-binding SPASM domain